MFTITLLICSIGFQMSNGARILGIISTPSYSHQIAFRPLWKELSLRGHQVTVLTTDPMNDPALTNLTEIDLHFSYELWNKNVLDIVSEENFLKTFRVLLPTMDSIADQQLHDPRVQALIKNETEHFDLLMLEPMPVMAAFAARFKCPFIGMTSMDPPSSLYEIFGNPVHPVVNPDSNLPVAGKLTFWQRVHSVIYNIIMKLYMIEFGYDWQQPLVEKHFGRNYPPLEDIVFNMSMLFVNTDPILYQIRPLVPAIIQTGGGTHRQPPKPLPKDLKMLLDNATQGFIYFSLGTNVKSKDFSKSTLKIILEVFAELPYVVLWKFELPVGDLPIKPKNVFISSWYPQQDVFKHPNIKLFITQGGQQSMEEAIYDHIPMVGMPFFGDQPANVKRLVVKGLGLSVDRKNLDKKILKNTILEVVNNPKYRSKVTKVAELARDQPMTGLEKAVWWTEYVLRHKGARHLRSPTLDVPLYQYLLLDVIGFCVLVVSIVTYLLIKLVRLFFKLMKYLTSKPKIKIN